MVTIRNVLNCVQPPRHTTPFFTQHGGMEDERRWDAENCRMRCGKLSYGECITELAKSHFLQWRKYFQRRQSSLGVLLFPCNPWLFSKGICSKLFSLHLTRSFELRRVYILLWIWWIRKSCQVECEHSVRFDFRPETLRDISRNGPLAPVGQKVDSATAANTNFPKTFVTPTPILCLFTKKYEQYTKHHARVILCEKKNFAKH